MSNKTLKIYTDGSSLGNPGPGGWGVVMIANDQLPINNKDKTSGKETIIKELGGHEKNTTNNRMELTAVIETLKCLKSDFQHIKEIIIYADSNYVLNGVTSWIYNWEKNGWKTANKKPVLNQDLWQELIALVRNTKIKINWEKVKGHSGHVYNDRADEIATTYADKQKRN